MNQIESFKDILIPRREEFSNFAWVSRKLDTVVAYKHSVRPKPETHKKEVLSCQRIQELIKTLSNDSEKPVEELELSVRLILDEIGFNKQLKIIRWLGLVLTKINQKIYTGIYVNEDSINRIKTVMGNCPVVFAPSHRSYADFILMSYVCFNYDIEIPAIAAGMDFHGMLGMSSVLRDTGAFFMRRTYNNDLLYWETFKQYVHQIVTRGDLPIEFFIEGTRSRSCKSLVPKFGLLSMIMKPLFTGEVPDILIVPINISYDRVLEEKLFAFELLGIPKPKESTSGFLKSLSIIKENYGSIYVDFTTAISAKKYFGEKLNQLAHTVGPLHHQQLNSEDKNLINDIGYETLRVQRQHAVLLPFNLAAVFLSQNNKLTLPCLRENVDWLRNILQDLGARIANDPLEDIFKVHNGLVGLDSNDNIELILNNVNLDNIDGSRLKAHRLSNETMTKIIPHIMLQLYVNPILHYLVDCCLVTVGIRTFGIDGKIIRGDLYNSFQLLREIFSVEFAFYNKQNESVFEETLQKLQHLKLIEINNNFVVLNNNEELEVLFTYLLSPFVFAYCCMCHILQTMSVMSLEHTSILTEAQKKLEVVFTSSQYIHPYSLNLDTLSNCLLSLSTFGTLIKMKEGNDITYKINHGKLHTVSTKLSTIATKCYENSACQLNQVISHLQAKL